jgi:hypothetical protein
MSDIIIKLSGGLGNQLFQFAIATSAKAYKPTLKICFDITFFGLSNLKYPRFFLLNELCYEADIYTVKDQEIMYNFISKVYTKFNQKKLYRKSFGSFGTFFYLLNCRFGNIIKEHFESGYNCTILKRLKNSSTTQLVLDGYWADIRYFQDNLPLLRRIIALRNRSEFFEKNVSSVRGTDVMIHIRRGDYLTIGNSENGLFVGTAYYLRATQILSKEGRLNADTRFWVFSDDYEWCRITLPQILPDVEFVLNPESMTDTESFEMMRYFYNVVCANSTYSLWAAYLNYNDEQSLVIYSQEWAKSYSQIGFKLIPSSSNWICT